MMKTKTKLKLTNISKTATKTKTKKKLKRKSHWSLHVRTRVRCDDVNTCITGENALPVPACSWWRPCWSGYRQQTVPHCEAVCGCYELWCRFLPHHPVTWTCSNIPCSSCSTPWLSRQNWHYTSQHSSAVTALLTDWSVNQKDIKTLNKLAGTMDIVATTRQTCLHFNYHL